MKDRLTPCLWFDRDGEDAALRMTKLDIQALRDAHAND
jgi:hypothetical protein